MQAHPAHAQPHPTLSGLPPMTNSIADALADALVDGGWRSKARPSQLPPPGDWNGWLVMAGRGFGKNFTGAGWIHELVETGAAGRKPAPRPARVV